MASHYIFFENGRDGASQGFLDPEHILVAWSPDQVETVFQQMHAAHDVGKWLAGFSAYELGYVLEPSLASCLQDHRKSPLICFGVFDAPDVLRARGLMHSGRQNMGQAKLTPPDPMWSLDRYTDAFHRLHGYIGAGDIYQANLTFPMVARWSGEALGLYAALREMQAVHHGAIADLGEGPVLLSRSPELFFQVDAEGIIETRPMKGTTPRGATQAEDDRLKYFLATDEKNRAENLMIVDLLRNDISRVAEIGSVHVPELFTVETYETVHQMTSLVRAKLRTDASLRDIFDALFPCGSITGAPKIRAMEIIHELEESPRDIYCGTMGWIAPTGEMRFNVAIRTLSLFDDGLAHLNVGGGVVWDSTAASEYEEALWKARYTKMRRQGPK
ncbi:MAG: aminodeoxychorismate synthase component I [Pseudomonadota bacterium]